MDPFVGREHEIAELRARLASALTGTPQVVQIEGPGGIGKTALLEQFVQTMRTGAVPAPAVFWASGEESEQLLPYGIVEQLVRSARSVLGNDAVLPSLVLSGPLDDPVSVGTRLLAFLDGVEAGAVVIIDDAQWADQLSLQALIFTWRRLVADRVLTVLAVNDDRPPGLPDSVRRLTDRRAGTALRLAGLDSAHLQELARSMGLAEIGMGTARRLHRGTLGNPLHARAFLEEFPPGGWGDGDEPLPPPRSFRRLVEDRYLLCAAPTRALLDAAAVLGPHPSLPTTAALAGVGDAPAALDEAARHDLLRTSGSESPWTLAFPHPLVQAAVYQHLGPAPPHRAASRRGSAQRRSGHGAAAPGRRRRRGG